MGRVNELRRASKASERPKLAKRMRWRRDGGGARLTGGLVELDDGTYRMSVDGFVTSRELYEVYNLTPALTKKFFPKPDATALLGEGDEIEGWCDLYAQQRVADTLNTEDFRFEWAKTERRREAARKGMAKRTTTLARKRAIAEQKEAEARAAFGGCVYIGRCTYAYGWIELSVWAKDADHAKDLLGRWLRSEECGQTKSDLFDDAINRYKEVMEEYREDVRYGLLPDETLHKPNRPKKSEFTLFIESIRRTGLHTDHRGIEEVYVERDSESWDHVVRRTT